MAKINVLIDTNIYRKCPSRNDLPFKGLERLCKAGVIKLHLPYVVEREFQTQQSVVYKKDLDDAIKAFSGLLKKGLSPAHQERAVAIRDELTASVDPILADVEAAFPNWAESIGGQRHPITEQDAKAAMEAYFLGKPPLTVAKERKDIPDSFIFQIITQLSGKQIPLAVVAEDGKVFNASNDLPNVSAFKSLAEFIEQPLIQAEFLDLDVKEKLESIRVEFKGHEASTGMVAFLIEHQASDKLYGKVVHSHSIPDDNNDGAITGYWSPEDLELDYENLHYFGGGEFGLPFEFDITVEITYYIFKSDFYLLDEEKMPSVSDHNDHYFEAESEYRVHVSGVVKLSIDPDLLKQVTPEVLEEYLVAAIDSIDEIKVVESDK